MTVTEGKILTAESIPKYLEDHLNDLKDVIDDVKDVKVTPIMGGNVNYAFLLSFNEGKTTLFLKQAPEFVAIFGPDGFPLTSERMQREMDVYDEWKTLLGDELSKKYFPEIYFFDSKSSIFFLSCFSCDCCYHDCIFLSFARRFFFIQFPYFVWSANLYFLLVFSYFFILGVVI